jgi:MFS family permease
MILQGMGRAFSSGSIDALAMEDALERGGEGSISGAASSLSVYQSVGIAAGALIGGLLPNYQDYTLHLMVRMGLLITVTFLAAFFLKEQRTDCVQKITLRGHLSQSRALFAAKRTLRDILLCIMAASVVLFSVETYWQPAFAAIAADNAQALSGVLCAAGFAATTLSSFVMGRLKLGEQRQWWITYFILLGGMALSVLILAFQHTIGGFTALYILFYASLGAAAVPEQTIINAAVPNETRAAILSTASLSSQMGGVFSSVMCTFLVGAAGFSGIWQLGAFVTIAVILYAFIIQRSAGLHCMKRAD